MRAGVSLERPHAGGSFALETGVPTVVDAQRERGEVAIEGIGTLELAAEAREGLHRIDVRELSASLQALATLPVLSAFRYQRTGSVALGIGLDVKRFPDAGVLAAVADRAEATTLVTGEGRALTEVKLHVQNRAQPFLKVLLPAGASMVSVEVAGESAKPVSGTDGTRVPLLRPGFRPMGSYEVSFVYLHAGAPLARKGDMPMALPKMDMPVGIVNWEVFVPDRYSAQAVGGNAIDMRRFSRALAGTSRSRLRRRARFRCRRRRGRRHCQRVGHCVSIAPAAGSPPGRILGRAVDPSGASVPGATVSLTPAINTRASSPERMAAFPSATCRRAPSR